jgi:release factor glutamine methyltransferase
MRNEHLIEQILRQGGIENAAIEAQWITEYGENNLEQLAQRRIAGEPLQYLLGEWEFYGYPMKVGKGVLIPRPETELLVDLAKQHNPQLVLDLCAGTGCVGIALARETGCKIIAVENSRQAIKYLKANIALNNVENLVEVVHADIFDYQLPIINCQLSIVINPPYLSRLDMESLQTEVSHEPYEALFGGNDGLNFYRKFFNVWGDRLKQAKLAACEVGDSQAQAVSRLMEKIGLNPQIIKDYNSIERVIYHA